MSRSRSKATRAARRQGRPTTLDTFDPTTYRDPGTLTKEAWDRREEKVAL